jgi:hypothetical protein
LLVLGISGISLCKTTINNNKEKTNEKENVKSGNNEEKTLDFDTPNEGNNSIENSTSNSTENLLNNNNTNNYNNNTDETVVSPDSIDEDLINKKLIEATEEEEQKKGFYQNILKSINNLFNILGFTLSSLKENLMNLKNAFLGFLCCLFTGK